VIGPGPSSIERVGTLKAPAFLSPESNLRRVHGKTEIRPLRHEVRVGGWPISYEAAGEGEPVVLVHGLSGSTRWWSRNVPAIAERYRTYLVDLPGFGTLRSLRRRFVLAETATWLSEWMEAAGLERVHLVGHSMGGYISIRLAVSRPELVRRLVLVAPAGVPAERSMLGHLVPLLLAARYATPAFMPVLVRDALRMGPMTLWRAARALLAEDAREDLRSIDAPTLLIWGEKDPLISPSVGDFLRREIVGSHLLVLQNAGHVPMFDRPQEFNAALLTFLGRGAVVE
jgi:pimeloyl-ACP methyl ester carboxylesterase